MSGFQVALLGSSPGVGASPLSASPSATSFSGTSAGSGTAITGTCTITASGGTAPYTYAWTRTAGDTGTTISSGTAASVTWSRVYGPAPRTDSSTWKCAVRDSAGDSFTVSGISVTLDNI